MEKLLKGIPRSILPEFSLVLRSCLMLQILQWLSVTDCLETHKMCLIFELAWCWGFFSCFFSCNIYHHAEVYFTWDCKCWKGKCRLSWHFCQCHSSSVENSPVPELPRCLGKQQQPRSTYALPLLLGAPEGWNSVLSSYTRKLTLSGSHFPLLWEGRERWCWTQSFVRSAQVRQGQRTQENL